MIVPSTLHNANGRCLKRAFTSVATSSPPSPERSTVTTISRRQADNSPARAATTKRRGLRATNESMQSTAGPRLYEQQIPSFMTVYDMDLSTIESPGVDPPTKTLIPTYITHQPFDQPHNQKEHVSLDAQLHSHQHRESTSTQASDSTDSSPTTTISTADSSTLTDPSPSSSPESPITLVPLSSFSASTFGLDNFQSLKMVDSTPIRLPLNDERPMTSPGPRKAKNPKSLALNLNLNVESAQSSEPSSPSFIKPPALKGRRKPSLLSLNTGAANQQNLNLGGLASPGIPTMLQRRSLKHSISSPQMLSTPGFGPAGGMTLGDRNPPRLLGISRLNNSNLGANTFTINEDGDHEPSTGPQMATRVPGASVGGDSFDRPHSGEDAKSPSYPEGPILMHEPSVHLYLEPKLEEAMQFDVVINVAREVKNPFKEMDKQDSKDTPSTASSDSKTIIPEPDTAASLMSFRTAFEVQPPGSTESSPTTPKPTPERKIPEYIHVPWDHNTDVKDELWDLCQTIEARVKAGKRVLVHCQQGASRSATLIIAYGMYINQDLTANESYTRAQAKSRWVNPNMSLLFSLNDFKKLIEKKKAEKNVWKTQGKHRPTLSVDETLELPTPNRARGNSTPSSTARDNALASRDDNKQNTSVSDTTIRRLADFDFGFGDSPSSSEKKVPNQPDTAETSKDTVHEPVMEVEPHHSSSMDWEELMSPRVAEMTDNPLERAFSRSFGSSSADQPSTPNLFSPRAVEYPRSSFFATLQSALPSEDPRSPPTRGEAPITRSIDDFL
ncbi:hypothetical protein B0O99DRAFT_709309 [Bisporella sp. PMI_857]|nr:hypothetical protein B0O99DRAFT_709309 [Bisporella sp. PMI_857]